MSTRLTPPISRSPYGFVGCVLLGFTVCWSVGTLTVDFLTVRGAVHQLRSVNYAAAEGQMTKCQVTEDSSDEGVSYDVRAEYTYWVGGRQYTARRVHHLNLWNRASASGFAADHPPGSRVTVYYDPADPADAVLLPGVGGPELFQLMFLVPFNVIMFGLASCLVQAAVFWHRPDPEWPNGVHFLKRQDEVRVRFIKTTPAAAALTVLMGTSFFGTFVVAFGAGFPPPTIAMVILWLVILGGAGFAYRRRQSRIAAGKDDLIIDRRRKKLSLPHTFGRTGPVVVPLADVLAVEVDVVETKDEDSHQVRFAPTVRWRDADGEPRHGKLADWVDRAQADRLVQWIKSKAGLEPLVQTIPVPTCSRPLGRTTPTQ